MLSLTHEKKPAIFYSKNKMEKVRKAKAEKALKKTLASKIHKETLSKNISSSLQAENCALKQELINLKKELFNLKSQMEETTHSILQDLTNHTADKRIEYSSETLALAMEILAISPKAYSILSKKLNFPNSKTVEEKYRQIIGNFPEKLTNISEINNIVNNYREKCGIEKGKSIAACLSVDAICFSPDVKISQESEIFGIEFNEELKKFTPDNLYSMFTEDPKALDMFIELNFDSIIKAGFVFQIQPYDVKYKPFVVHVLPAPNGKASTTVVEILHKIREEVEKRNIIIKSYAFDGDNAYLELHKMYYESYISKAIKTEKINIKRTQTIRVVSDYLHILKRLRYRLLSCIIHAGFNMETASILLEDLQNILNDLPPIVWCNEIYTKMHDKLPLELFKLENFLKLLDNSHFAAAAYWFPIALSLVAITGNDLGFQNRLFLLQTSFWFLVFYKDQMDNEENIAIRQQKYGDNNHVSFYTNEMLIEFTNTLHAHIQLMCNVDDFSFDRNSTTPLEHKFGHARRRAHDVHTLQKFLRTISSFQVVEQQKILEILNENEKEIQIHCRANTVGVTVESSDLDEDQFLAFQDDEDAITNFCYSPQTCAKAMLHFADFDFPYSEFI